jgi:hypothetical protein
MRKGLKMSLLAALALLLAMGTPAAAFGAQAGNGVTVKIPGFPVIINGTAIDNGYDKYPFIVYNDITYFPMTYTGCRFLGLESDWKGNTEGLSIAKTGVTAAWKPYKSTSKNGGSYKAVIPSFPIRVNGKAVDNGSQKYPLLSFRDITYFPMTWEFGVNEFGWDYSFSAKDGLMIDSDNVKLEQKTLAAALAKREYLSSGYPGNVTVTDKYIYYEDTKGQIMQAELANPATRKAVYQLPAWSYGDGKELVYGSLSVENNEAYLKYHQGGAVMGSDWLFRLNDDGTTTELQSSYTRAKTFGDKTFSYWTGGAPGAGNLSMKTGDGEPVPLGDPDYLYGWSWQRNEDGSQGGGGSDDVYLVGDNLYILAFHNPYGDEGKKGETNGIYRININTGETVRVSGKEVMAFKMDGDFLYYHSDGTFYRQSVKEGKEEEIRQVAGEPEGTGSIFTEPNIPNFLVLNGKIYWQKQSDQGLYDIDGKNLNEGAALDDMAIMGSDGEYLACTFQETDTSKYRIMVFDRDGNVVFKTSDKAYCRNISIFGGKIYFYSLTTGTVCIGQLTK